MTSSPIRPRLRGLFIRLGVCVVLAAATTAHASATRVLDDFEALDGWTVVTSEGASLQIASDTGFRGRGMRLDFDLRGGGYVNVNKAFDLPLPDNYVFSFRVRGDAPVNGFEFKVLDTTGRNVWWHTDRHMEFPHRWERRQIRRSRLVFAWGPSGGTPLDTAGSLEFTITAATGGKGSVWIDDLEIAELDPTGASDILPTVSASTELTGFPAANVLASGSGWRSEPLPDPQWLQLDFGTVRELGGIVLTWDDTDFATSYQVRTSKDGRRWRSWRSQLIGNGGRDYIDMPDADARYLRIEMHQSSRGKGYALRAAEVRPFAFSATPNHFFAAVATEATRGWYPRYFLGEQTWWTPVGIAGDSHEALLSADGVLEVDEGDFSIEPFLRVDGVLQTWADRKSQPSLLDGHLPIPTVTRKADSLELGITAIATGVPGSSATWVRYRVRNTGPSAVAADLFLAMRPFQVNPPWQSLRRPGGFAPIRSIRIDKGIVRINEQIGIHLLNRPDASGAAVFAESALIEDIARGGVPPHPEVDDPDGYAAAAARYEVRLEPGESRDIIVAIPFRGSAADVSVAEAPDPQTRFADLLAEVRGDWQRLTSRVVYRIPAPDEHLGRIARSTLAWILVNADRPAIQPGSRAYARSWIRDGAETTAALVQSGAPGEGAAFLRWFAGHQWPSGKVPCCIDSRGRDPVPEHDSPGQLIFAIAEYYRYSRDIGLVADLWPNVIAAADYLTELRAQRLTPAYDTSDLRLFRGLVPESISHEGYASQPMHSYWDDFFAVRGFRDAAFLARLVGDDVRARIYRDNAVAMATDVRASIELAMQRHGIDYIPGAAELGDFDANSTAIAVAPLGEAALLPEIALRNTFTRYLGNLEARLAGTADWEGYTPYELRNADALLRLGEPASALRVLRAVVADQRPAAWNQWQEIVWRDATAPRFIGDMPHTWIGAMYLRVLRSLFAYEDEASDALVLGAGLAPEWIDAAEGVGVERLPTHYGTLSLHVRRETPRSVRVRIDGDVRVPEGKLRIRLPIDAPLRRVVVDGKAITSFDARTVSLDCSSCVAILEYGDPAS
jgi:hypothetical protein